MNPREFEILSLLSTQHAAGGPLPKPVHLAQTLAVDPDAPSMTDLLAVAAGTASDPKVVTKVNEYCEAHPEYGEVLELYKQFAKDEEIPEPPVGGSVLERMRASDSGRAGATADKGRTTEKAEGWSHALAASTGGPPDTTAAGGGAARPTDWWVLRPTSDGGELYVGDPDRVRSGDGWEAVVVNLPTGPRRGSLAFSSPDLVVVLLERLHAPPPEGNP